MTLADIEGPGTIRHIWITVPDTTEGGPFVLRDLILRAYWDDEESPSVEVPLGDFFCNGFGSRALVTSHPIVVAPTGGMNSYFPMPFRRRARIVLDSEHAAEVGAVFYQVDYTVGDDLGDDVAYFHAQWRRSNGTTELGEDHVIVDGIEGSGAYVGTYIALTALERYWWGEGEVKFYIDGDDAHPTQCSTGLEDYAGGAWAFQDRLANDPPPAPVTFSAPYFGYPHASWTDQTKASPFTTAMPANHGMYRWHLPDPVLFTERLRVTLQQIGAWDHGLFERSDDISSTAYWYQTGVHAPFPELPAAPHRRPR
ncbi:glycoside hydrolase family 172 protein [Streptomyces xiamenensis]